MIEIKTQLCKAACDTSIARVTGCVYWLVELDNGNERGTYDYSQPRNVWLKTGTQQSS